MAQGPALDDAKVVEQGLREGYAHGAEHHGERLIAQALDAARKGAADKLGVASLGDFPQLGVIGGHDKVIAHRVAIFIDQHDTHVRRLLQVGRRIEPRQTPADGDQFFKRITAAMLSELARTTQSRMGTNCHSIS